MDTKISIKECRMTVREIKKKLKEMGHKGYSRLKKNDLLQLLHKTPSQPKPRQQRQQRRPRQQRQQRRPKPKPKKPTLPDLPKPKKAQKELLEYTDRRPRRRRKIDFSKLKGNEPKPKPQTKPPKKQQRKPTLKNREKLMKIFKEYKDIINKNPPPTDKDIKIQINIMENNIRYYRHRGRKITDKNIKEHTKILNIIKNYYKNKSKQPKKIEKIVEIKDDITKDKDYTDLDQIKIPSQNRNAFIIPYKVLNKYKYFTEDTKQYLRSSNFILSEYDVKKDGGDVSKLGNKICREGVGANYPGRVVRESRNNKKYFGLVVRNKLNELISFMIGYRTGSNFYIDLICSRNKASSYFPGLKQSIQLGSLMIDFTFMYAKSIKRKHVTLQSVPRLQTYNTYIKYGFKPYKTMYFRYKHEEIVRRLKNKMGVGGLIPMKMKVK